MVRFFRAMIFIGLIFSAAGALSAAQAPQNWYVLKSATGSNNGTSWTNAWKEMNQINWSSINCGDTVWLGGGTYTTGIDIGVTKNCASGAVLNVNRVLSTDSVPVAAAGWNSSFDSQVILTNINVEGPAAYITINGREWQGGVLGSGGIEVVIPGTEGDGIDAGVHSFVAQPIDHISWKYIEILGPACVEAGTCSGGGVVGVQIMPFCAGAIWTNLLMDHLSVHRTGEAFRGCGQDGTIVQYSLIYDTHNDGQQHPDLIYSNPPYQNVTWRYNKIFQSANDGLFFEGSTGAANFRFYGNIMYEIAGWSIAFKTGSNYGPVFIYNNIFESDGVYSGEGYPTNFMGSGGSYNLVAGSEIANNIFYQGSNQFSSTSSDFNAYNGSGFGSLSETGTFYFPAGSPLNSFNGWMNMGSGNPVAADFHLTAAGATLFQGKGKNLGAPYNVDMDGNTRPASGPWTLGPFEVQGSGSNPPQAPTGLMATVQ